MIEHASIDSGAKSATAFRTIGEVSRETGLPQHVLRFWETRFPALRPLQRAGNRRYYRPDDVALVRRIDQLLNHDGYTIRGVQQMLQAPVVKDLGSVDATRAVRDLLARALADD